MTPPLLRSVQLLSVVLLLAAPVAHADVTLESRTTMTMIGGAGSGPTVVEVAGRKRRETRDLALTGSITEKMGDASTLDIVRLDRGLVWRLDPDSKTYDEIPVARFAEAMRQSADPALDPGPLAALKNYDLKWSVTSEATGAVEAIAGFDAKQTVLTLKGTGADPGTGMAIELKLDTELWTTTALPGYQELRSFDAAFAKAAGVDQAWVAGMVSSLHGAGDALAQYAVARAKVKGYPIRTVVRVAMPSMAEMLDALKGMMGADDGPGLPGGGVVMMSTTELVSVQTTKIAPDRFAVPADYAKNPSKWAKKSK